jgi:hypothetical protein
MARILYVLCRLIIGLIALAIGIIYALDHNYLIGPILIVLGIGALLGQKWAYTLLFVSFFAGIIVIPNSLFARPYGIRITIWGSVICTALLPVSILTSLLANHLDGKDYNAIWKREINFYNTLLWIALVSNGIFIMLLIAANGVSDPQPAVQDFGPLLFFLPALLFGFIGIVSAILVLPYFIVSRLPPVNETHAETGNIQVSNDVTES